MDILCPAGRWKSLKLLKVLFFYLGIRCAGSVSHFLRLTYPLCLPVTISVWLHLMGPWKGFWSWSGWAERGWGGGREGEPIGAAWQDLLHGRRVQFTAGTLGALRLGNPLVMRTSESDSTIRLSSNLCYSDPCSHAPLTDSRTMFKTTCFNL